jgi:hypothetical protein
VSNRHITEAWKVPLPAREKLVLLAQADHACDYCGLGWPGLRLLGEKTGVGKTGLRDALEKLLGLGLVELHAYGQGGRGCSTVYRVLPALIGAQAPCPKCQANLRTPAVPAPRKPRAAETARTSGRYSSAKPTGRADGFALGAGEYPPDARTVSTIPTGNEPETHRTTNAASAPQCVDSQAVAVAVVVSGASQPSVESKPSPRAYVYAREGQEAAAAPRVPGPTRHTPGSVAEILARTMPGLRVSAVLDGIPVTAAVSATPEARPTDRGEAQTRGQRARISPRASPAGPGGAPLPVWAASGGQWRAND